MIERLLVAIWQAWRPFSAEKREARRIKRAARRGDTLPAAQQTGAENVDLKAFVIQALLAAIRHGLTAGGVYGAVGEEGMAQIAGVLAILVGGAWSLARKWAQAKAQP